MIFILSSCSVYCFIMTIVLAVFSFSTKAFTGTTAGTECLVDGVDYSTKMYNMMLFGFITHLIGFFCDSAMAIRVVSKNKAFNIAALVACSLYTIAFIIWLIWIMVVRWSASGKYCSGE